MNAKKYGSLEQNLFQSLRLYRLREEVRIVEEEIKDEERKNSGEKTGFQKFTSGVASIFQKPKEEKRAKDLQDAKSHVDAFLKGLEENVDTHLSEDADALRQAIDQLYERDNGSRRLMMGLQLALSEGSGEDAFVRGEESRKQLSTLLFGDPEMIGKILEVYVYSYQRIEGADRTKTVDQLDAAKLLCMLGTRITLFAGWTGIGAIVGLSMNLSALALFGSHYLRKRRPENAGNDLYLFSSLIAGKDIRKKRFGRRAKMNIRQLGRDCPTAEYIHAIASGITVFNFRFENKESDAAKSALALYIEMIDNLRADAEYLAFVERVDIEENQQKIDIANRAIALLGDLIENDEERKKAA